MSDNITYKKIIFKNIAHANNRNPQNAVSFRGDLLNKTSKQFKITMGILYWGSWVHTPPSIIGANNSDYFECQGTSTSGTQGMVKYAAPGATFEIQWSQSYWGNIKYTVNKTDPESLYKMDIFGEIDQLIIEISENNLSVGTSERHTFPKANSR